MRPHTLAERAAFVSAAIGIAVGLLFLFAPIQGYCMSSASATAPPLGATPGPPVTFGPQVCGSEALWQRQPIFPMPFFAVLVWSLAPAIAYVGVRLRVRGERVTGTGLMVAGVLLAFSSIISFGAGPFFLPFVFLPTLVTTAIALVYFPTRHRVQHASKRESEMAEGTIKKLVSDRGFGFISQADGTEIFFHRSKVVGSFDTLSEGQKVSYEKAMDPRRNKESAEQVTPL